MSDIVITGIGLATPLGLGREPTWAGLTAGRSAVKPDTEYPGILSARLSFEVPPAARALSAGFLAAAEALHDAGIAGDSPMIAELGWAVCGSKTDLYSKCDAPDGFSPGGVAERLRRVFRPGGPARAGAAACATGALAIAIAADWIRRGECALAIAGGIESAMHPLYIAGFRRMGVLARNRAAPFDRRREGFAIGEGAGFLVLESRAHALIRGARPRALLSGWAMGCGGVDTVRCDPSGGAIAATVGRALARAGDPVVGYVNAHGTGTIVNDAVEARAICAALPGAGAQAKVSSTKAATGHLLAAAGSVEAALCALAVERSTLPPSLNLDEPDTALGLSFTGPRAAHAELQAALSLSFGFGGQIVALAVARA